MRIWVRRCIALALVCASPLVPAVGWVMLLRDTPAERFEEDDIRMFLDTAKQVLEATGPAEVVAWSNANTGAGGRFRVLSETVGKDGAPCKRVRIGVYATRAPEKAVTWTACRAPDGRWKLVGAS